MLPNEDNRRAVLPENLLELYEGSARPFGQRGDLLAERRRGSYSFPYLAVMSVQEVVWSRMMSTDWAKKTVTHVTYHET